MGMDIPNVHYLVHYNPPAVIEDYLQEVGRAGRNKALYNEVFGKEKIRKDAFLSVTFAIGTQLFMQLGRAGIAALMGHPADVCIRFITTDVLSCLFTAVIIWIVRRVEGLFEDQKLYLLRIQQEQTVERGEQF
jgi:hypothetical protein